MTSYDLSVMTNSPAGSMKCCKLKWFTGFLVLLSGSLVVFYLCNLQNPGWIRHGSGLSISGKLHFVQYFQIERNPSNWTVVSGYDYAEEKAGNGNISETAALQQDMERCSLAMGISAQSLQKQQMDIKIIVKNANALLNAIWSVVPRHNFSRCFKNPCWYSNKAISDRGKEALVKNVGQYKNTLNREQIATLTQHAEYTPKSNVLHCMPYFFIAGFPKCGTTSIHSALRQHPMIYNITDNRKEPHWWTRVPLKISKAIHPRKTSVKDFNHDYLNLVVFRYLINYSGAAITIGRLNDVITYDGSQSTLWDSNFFLHTQDYCAMPAIILRVLPKAKFVVIMRNPITRLYSHYLFICTMHLKGNISTWLKKTQMGIDPAGKFHKEVELEVKRFNTCIANKNNSLFGCVGENRFQPSGCGRVGYKLGISIYFVHLVKWLQFYPKEQFLFLRMEDIDNNTDKFLSTITNFLGLDPVSPELAKQWLGRKANVQTLAAADQSKIQMWNRTRTLLEDFFRPYNIMLAELIGDQRFLWNDQVA